MRRRYMALSRILEKRGKIEIGLQFVKLVLSSLLNTGSTLLILSLSGTVPVEKRCYTFQKGELLKYQ